MKRFRQFTEGTEVAVAANGRGTWSQSNSLLPRIESRPVATSHGNEPFKDERYFRRPGVKKHLASLDLDNHPPVLALEHPADPSTTIVVDGNHRLYAHRAAGSESIPHEIIPHHDIHLVPPYKPNLSTTRFNYPSLHSFREKDGSYDVHKAQPKLGGLTLNHYFVQPGGTNSFVKKDFGK